MMKVQIIGHLGHAPRINQLPSGDPVLNLSVAAKRYRKGESEDYWWDVTMFGERGLKLHDMLHKGSHVYVEGEYGERSYTDKQGNARVQREIVARDIRLLDSKADAERRAANEPRTSRPMPAAGQQQRYTAPPQQQRTGFGGNHRDDFAAGGRAQGRLGGQETGYGMPDDDIPF